MGLIGVRLAPGVRVTLSSRGVRAHVGPRPARLHVGAGRTGVSTGAGPLTYYTSVGTASRARSRPPRAATPAQQEKAERAATLAAELALLERRHEHQFPPMTRPVAQLEAPSRGQTLPAHRAGARRGVPWYDVVGRARARAAARERAEVDDRAAVSRYEQEVRNRQEELDGFWRRLTANEPGTVIPFLQEAFEDNQDPAAVVGLDDGEAFIVVAAPSADVVPDHLPGLTPTGRPSVRKMPAKSAAAYHRQAVAGTILVTVREAFAVAPGLSAVKVAAVQGAEAACLVWSVRVRRVRLEPCLSAGGTSVDVLQCAADEDETNLVGAARRLGPVDPSSCGWGELFAVLENSSNENSPQD